MTREEAKNMAQSRDCKCVNGKDRDNNYNNCIDEIFDYYERIIEKLDNNNIRQSLISFEKSKHNFLNEKHRIEYATNVVDNYLGR